MEKYIFIMVPVMHAFKLSCIYLCLVALVLESAKITPDRVKILVGRTLKLNCTGNTTYNGRLQFDWDFPRAVSQLFTLLMYLKKRFPTRLAEL